MPLISPAFPRRRANRASTSFADPCPPPVRRVRGWRVGLLLLPLLILLLAACTPQLGAATTGWSPLAMQDGMVYIATKQGEVKALQDNGFDGAQLRWTYPPEGSSERLQGAYNPPVVGERFVYVAAANGHLYAIDKTTGMLGETGWKRPEGSSEGRRPLVGSPALNEAGDVVVVGSEDGNLYAYNADTGEPLPWSPFQVGAKIWSSPTVSDGVVYFGSHDHSVYAVSLADGQLRWQFATGGAVFGKPLVTKGLVIIGSLDKKLYALDVNNGSLRWFFEAGNWFWANPAANGEFIFAPSLDGNVYALNYQGGEVWRHDLGASVVSSPALVNRGLVVASTQGKVAILDIRAGDLGSSREVASYFARNAQVKAPLVAAAESVYIGADNSTVRRLQVRGDLTQMWCFNTTGDGPRCE